MKRRRGNSKLRGSRVDDRTIGSHWKYQMRDACTVGIEERVIDTAKSYRAMGIQLQITRERGGM